MEQTIPSYGLFYKSRIFYECSHIIQNTYYGLLRIKEKDDVIMNTQKYYLHNSDLLLENDRSLYQKQMENGEVCYDSTSRSKIDFSRTHLNWNACPHSYSKQIIIQKQESVRKKKFPKNGVLFGSTIITVPRDYDSDLKEFFKTAYEGLKEIYHLTDDDVISAYVHMDETTPHMHFNFIPRHENSISWEKTMPKFVYDTQHRLLEEYITQRIGEVHLLNGETLGFDVQQLTQEQKAISMEIYDLKIERDEIYQKIADLEYQRQKAEKDVEFYFSKGDVEKASSATDKWEICNSELPTLIKRKKKIAVELDKKLSELSKTKKPTSNQIQILELIADQTHLEEKCWEQAMLAQESNEQLQSLQSAIEKTIAKNQIDATAITDLLNKLELALGNAFRLGQQAEREKCTGDALIAFKSDSIIKSMKLLEEPLQRFKLFASGFSEKIRNVIDAYRHNANNARRNMIAQKNSLISKASVAVKDKTVQQVQEYEEGDFER